MGSLRYCICLVSLQCVSELLFFIQKLVYKIIFDFNFIFHLLYSSFELMNNLSVFCAFNSWVHLQWLLRIYVPPATRTSIYKAGHSSRFLIDSSHRVSEVNFFNITVEIIVNLSFTVVCTIWFQWFVRFNAEWLLPISIYLLEVMNFGRCSYSSYSIFILFFVL